MTERGIYKSEGRGRQLIRFDDCRIPGTNITPTDIDAIIEFHDKNWFLIEVKMEGVQVNEGQEVLITRFINDMWKAGKPSIAIIAEHNITDPEQDVYLYRDCKVRQAYYISKRTGTLVKDITKTKNVIECIENFRKYMAGGGA